MYSGGVGMMEEKAGSSRSSGSYDSAFSSIASLRYKSKKPVPAGTRLPTMIFSLNKEKDGINERRERRGREKKRKRTVNELYIYIYIFKKKVGSRNRNK